jgi:hypothetical protein
MSKWNEIKALCPRLYKHGMTFECGEGWAEIIKEFSLKIEKILEENARKPVALRFYMSTSTDEMFTLLEELEAISSQTCEVCGSPGKMRGKNWYEVRCDNCYKETK